MRDAVPLGDDRDGVGVPLRQLLALGDGGAVIGKQLGAVGHAMTGLLAPGIVEQHHLAVAAHDHGHAARVDDHVAVLDADLGIESRLDRGHLGAALDGAADMEGPRGERGARLAGRLGGDAPDRLADIDDRAAGEIAPIALAADADRRLAGQHRADADGVDARAFDPLDLLLVDQCAGFDDDIARQRIEHVDRCGATEDAVGERGDHLAAIDDGAHGETARGTAILLGDDRVLRDVDETARQVARIRRLERGVSETLAGAVRRVEVLENGQTFLEVRDDRRLDDLTRRLGHQAAHAGELLDLRRRAASAGIRHHPYRIDRLALLRGADDLHHLLGDLLGAARPHVDHLVVFLALGDQAVEILLLVFLDLGLRVMDELLLGLRHDEIVLAERDASLAGMLETKRHQLVAEDDGLLLTRVTVDLIDQVADLLFGQQPVEQIEADVAIARQDLRQQHAAGGRLDALDDHAALLVHQLDARLDLGVQRHRPGVERLLDLAERAERHALALVALALHRDVIETEHDVLRRHADRLAVRRAEDVVGRHHQHAPLELCLERQRHVHRHLVAVEIGVEGGADQRMELDRLAFDESGLEGLDAETMQRRSAVEQNRMLADDLFEDVPNFGTLLFDHALGRLDRRGEAVEFELRVDEGLEQLERHLLGQAALMQLELGTDDDDRAAGIVDALAEQVLPEAALLALEHVGERLQRPLVGAGDDAATTAVVEQRVDRLLQHALLVAHDDAGGTQLDQALQPVVAVDDAAIEIVAGGVRA